MLDIVEEKHRCPLCGKEYETPEEMAQCILRCSDENHKRKERERAEKLIKERAVRKQEILFLNDKLKDLVRKYREDYNDPFIIDGLHNYSVDLIDRRNAFESLIESIFK